MQSANAHADLQLELKCAGREQALMHALTCECRMCVHVRADAYTRAILIHGELVKGLQEDGGAYVSEDGRAYMQEDGGAYVLDNRWGAEVEG